MPTFLRAARSKFFATFGIVLLVVGMQPAVLRGQAIVVSGPETTAAGHERFEFLMDTTGAVGAFDAFELKIESNGLFNQVGTPAQSVMSPSEDSGFSAFLDCPNCFGGQGLSHFGRGAETDTVSLVQCTFASLGSNSASTQGNYLVANIVMRPGGAGIFSYEFFDDGTSLGPRTVGIPFGVPEPGSLTIFAVSCLALSGRRR